MEQYNLKNVKLPNGVLVKVPESATQEQTLAYAKAKGFMSEEEMMIYDNSKDMLDVADFYAEVDGLDLKGTPQPVKAAFDVIAKPLAKFAYAGYKEPKTIARALPDAGSVLGAGLGGVAAGAAALGTVPTALVLGIGSALGYLGGKEAEQSVTGVEQTTSSKLGESLEAGVTETGAALLPAAAKVAVRGGKALVNKTIPLSSEFANEAEREFAAEIAQKLKESDAGLLTTQVGSPTGTHRILGSIAFASSSGRERVEAVLKGQSDYLDKNISVIKDMYGKRFTDRQLGDMYVSLVEKQKELSKDAFEGMYADRLRGTETAVVSAAPIIALAKNQIGKIKGTGSYVDDLASLDDTILSKKEDILSLRQNIIDATEAKDTEALSSLRTELEQARLDLDVTRAERESYLVQNDIGMEEEEVVSLYSKMLKLQNKPDITVEELNSFNLNLKAKLRELESNNPAVANVKGFKGLTQAQELIEKQVKSKLTPEQATDYDALNKLYRNNNDVIRGNVVAGLMRRENTPTSIANSITASGNADYYSSIDEIYNATKQTLEKANVDSAVIKDFEGSINTLKNAVRRKYLDQNLQQFVNNDAFGSVGSFMEFINKEKKGDVFDTLFGSKQDIKRIDSLINDYNFLTKNLPKGQSGRFSLAVISQQSIGSREVLEGTAQSLAGDPQGITKFMQGAAKMFTPEALAWHITNPKEAMRLSAITKRAKKEAVKGRITLQTFTAMSNAYNDMLQSMEQEQNSEQIYKDVMNQMRQLEQ